MVEISERQIEELCCEIGNLVNLPDGDYDADE
jgi:hypothetical protein